MALRRWYDYNKDPLGSARPTVTRFKPVSARIKRLTTNPYGNYPTYKAAVQQSQTPYQSPYVNPYEIIDDIREQFEAQPVRFSTDPSTSKVIATKTMPKPEMPSEMVGMGRFGHLFGKGELTSKWILPQGALTGERFNQRTPPSSDYQRQLGYRFGVSQMGAPSTAVVSPETYWPSMAFKLPMREAAQSWTGRYTKPKPVFGGTVDYTTGEWRTPPAISGYADPYGKFDPSRKTPPTIGAYRPARSSRYRRFRRRETEEPEEPSTWRKSQRRLLEQVRAAYL